MRFDTTTPVENTEDIIDSREIIERIDYLESDDELDEWEVTELANLKTFRDELDGYCDDWNYGVTLIRDSYFEDYAREMAEEIGAISREASWPLSFIDWKAAAEALRMDYTSAEFDGVTYWAR